MILFLSSYSQHLDRMFPDSYKKAQVVMVRSLMSPFKMAVYYDYNQNMTKPLLDVIIKKLESAGAKVTNISFDMGK